jgi:hypothetical protein
MIAAGGILLSLALCPQPTRRRAGKPRLWCTRFFRRLAPDITVMAVLLVTFVGDIPAGGVFV